MELIINNQSFFDKGFIAYIIQVIRSQILTAKINFDVYTEYFKSKNQSIDAYVATIQAASELRSLFYGDQVII